MSFYVVVRNFDSVDYFPENKATDFRVKLNKPIDLKGRWKVALTEFFLSSASITSEPQLLQVMSNVCTETAIGSQVNPLLRQIPVYAKEDVIGMDFHPAFYHSVPHTFMDNIHIYIRDQNRREPILSDATISCTLHFIQE